MLEREWPKTFGVDPTTGDTVVIGPDGAPTKVPAGEPMIPATLGRELYEALKVADSKIEGEWSYRLDRVEDALARYEREVRDA